MSGGEIRCVEVPGGFITKDENGREYATASRGSRAITVNPMTHDDAISVIFALAERLIRLDESRPGAGEKEKDGAGTRRWYCEGCGKRTAAYEHVGDLVCPCGFIIASFEDSVASGASAAKPQQGN